jgi:phage terminase large subunit-like protein
MWAVACAAGSEEPWVREWLIQNQLPLALVPAAPGRVWVASPTFASAVEQIRPKLRRWCPEGTRFSNWENRGGEGVATLPSGGVIVSKAYRQFDQDPQTWEGAAIQGLVCDEQPNSFVCLTAGMSRLIDHSGKLLLALTPLRGKNDWLYRELVQKAPGWVRVCHLEGRDNPHVPQDYREQILAAMPGWQRASRESGEFTSPEGAILPISRSIHVIEPFEIPKTWVRWQGIDWGGRAPHVVWAAENKESGQLFVYRELALRRTTLEPAISDRQLLELVRGAEAQAGEAGQLCYRVADSESPGALEEAASQGLWLAPAAKGAGSVVAGLKLLEILLQAVNPLTLEPAEPRIKLFRTCPQLISELEGLKWREGVEEPDPACPDHGPDALRYLVQYRQQLGFR